MALDKDKRVLLQKLVSSARKLLSLEYSRILEGVYGLSESSGHIEEIESLTFNTDQEYEIAKILRARIDVYRESTPDSKEVINRLIRELSFTTLNRFAALKIFEERGIILESVSQGYNSKGFQLYKRVCDTSLGESYFAFRAYLMSLFDELTDDLNSVFDRYSEFGVLFPRETILTELLTLINDQQLEDIWANDEALGWMYQYFNLDAERKAMRDQSKNPRNSRELAVRNQFFTPRYVVESLVDNTLGRYWIECNSGKSELNNFCKYLLTDNEKKDHEKPKDPRCLKILDPACGSMHFGLYVFDVLEQIYKEAWDLETTHGASYFATADKNAPLTQDYANKEEFYKYIPKLIVENNINGVDIDSRAAQIAQLAIWLRAQKSWNDHSVSYNERPKILKNNIVVADSFYVSENLRTLFKDHLGDLYSSFESLEEELILAPMLGSLVRFDESTYEELNASVGEIQQKLLSFEKPDEITFLEFHNFKDSLDKTLKFVNVLLFKYDAVLMNPPFGEAAKPTLSYLKTNFREWNKNILCCFFEKAYDMLTEFGFVGAIYDRTALVKSTYEGFRKNHIIPNNRVTLLIDLGWEVLDANVEVTSIVLSRSPKNGYFVDLRNDTNKKDKLLNEIVHSDRIIREKSETFHNFPNSVIGYDFPDFARRAFNEGNSLSSCGFISYTGNQLKSDRHFRNWWEFKGNNSVFASELFNGCAFEPYFTTLISSVVSPVHPFELPIDSSTVIRNRNLHWKPSVAFGKRGEFFTAQLVESSPMFTVEGQSFLVDDKEQRVLLTCFLNTPLVRFLLNRYCGQHKYSGYVNMLPYKEFSDKKVILSLFENIEKLKNEITGFDFISKDFNPEFELSSSFEEYVTKVNKKIESYFECIRVLESECESQLEKAFGLNEEEIEMLSEYRETQPHPKSPIIDHNVAKTADYVSTSVLHYCINDAFESFNSDILTNYSKNKNLNTYIKEKLQTIFTKEENLENIILDKYSASTIDDALNNHKHFFTSHLKAYTKNRRVSPIYWPIEIGDTDFIIWLNYQKINSDTVLNIINDFLRPLEVSIKEHVTSSKENSSEKISLQNQLASVTDLKNKCISISKKWKIGALDGPLFIATFFRECFKEGSWSDLLNDTWDKIENGDFDWSTIAYTNFGSRVKNKIDNNDVIKVFQETNIRD